MSTDTCVFCQIVNGTADPMPRGFTVWPDAVAFEPLNPVTSGHMLVVPRGHVVDALEDPLVTGATFARAAQLAAFMAVSAWPCNLITSAGAVASQSIFHLHVHVVPRRTGDGLALPWTGQARATRRGAAAP